MSRVLKEKSVLEGGGQDIVWRGAAVHNMGDVTGTEAQKEIERVRGLNT